ncbi:hypothetical protein VTJ49DRAFT_1947 [Mycothermus thermophilus]|uniref:Uncharacterized protein n=1 Tax=Humicola insolens TaxID=85995 RepID=A0ABR3VN58_HUMIN
MADEQQHKAHRPSKKSKDKKKQSTPGKSWISLLALSSKLTRQQARTRKPSPSRILGNSPGKLPAPTISKRSVSMSPSSTVFPMNRPRASSPSSALQAWARQRYCRLSSLSHCQVVRDF